jgi:hypothetical protein
VATKSTIKFSARRLTASLLPWLILAIFAWVVYAGAKSVPVKWLDTHLQSLTRWPSQGNSTDLSGQLQLSAQQRSQTLDAAQKLLPGHWQGARIIGQISSTRHLLLLDLGTNTGIKRGQAVVVSGHLAGVIWQVTPTQSTVMLLGDPDFSVAAMVVGGKTDGLVETQNGGLVLDHVLDDPDIQNKSLMTSGQGEIVPAGLPVGKITSQISKSLNNESTWGVDYPGVNGQIWAGVYTGNNK